MELTEEKINAITDQIPQKPVTLVEGTSYLAVIIGAFTVRRTELSSAADARDLQSQLHLPAASGTSIDWQRWHSSSWLTAVCGCCRAQVLGFFIYNFVTNFVLEPTYQTCFNSTLQKLKQDPRITVRLGNDIVGKRQQAADQAQAGAPKPPVAGC